MIKDIFVYFSMFPKKEGVLSMAVNGTSNMAEYQDLLSAITNMSDERRVTGLDNYAYGQSFDELKARLDKCVGSYLFVDFGEFDIHADSHKSLIYTEQTAVTVAMKLGNNVDALERMIASNRTLQMLSRIHAYIMADVECGVIDWADRTSAESAEIVPFVASELNSVGWTLMFRAISPDALGTHELYRSFARMHR